MNTTCRWIIGQPTYDSFEYCDKPSDPDEWISFCPEHQAVLEKAMRENRS